MTSRSTANRSERGRTWLLLVSLGLIVTWTASTLASITLSPRVDTGFQKLGSSRQNELWIQGLFEYENRASNRRDVSLRVSVQADLLAQSTNGASGLNRSGSPQFLEDREAWIESSRGRWTLSLGSKILRYGVLDIYDPLDQINSRRFENPLASDKRGEWMMHIQRRSDRVGFEAFVIPEKRNAILPSTQSRWLPRKLYVPAQPTSEFVLPDNLDYEYSSVEDINGARNWAYGAKLNGRIESAEWAVQYDEGSANFPSLGPSVTGTILSTSPRIRVAVDPLIRLRVLETRERHFGGSLVAPLGNSLIRVQVAKTEPLYRGRDLARDRLDVGAALERPIGEVTLLMQGFWNALKPPETGNDISALTGLFDQALAIGLRWSISDTSNLTVGVLNSLAHESNRVIQASLGTDLNDSLRAEIATSLIDGGERSPLGTFDGNDSVSLKLSVLY